jgi:predicted ribosome-associated RNA-binding protein Tma20
MDVTDRIILQEKKMKKLELELNDLRQGLAVLQDYYCDLHNVFTHQEIAESRAGVRVMPCDDTSEFEGIWNFHKDILIPEPSAHVSCTELYKAFRKYCVKTGKAMVDQGAFEFIFARMENPRPELYRGEWKGCRIKHL